MGRTVEDVSKSIMPCFALPIQMLKIWNSHMRRNALPMFIGILFLGT